MSTPIADMVAQMLAAGVPHDAIVLAVATAERISTSTRHQVDVSGGNRVDAAAEKRREWDRNYRREKRTSGGNRVESGGNPPDNGVSAIYLEEREDLKKERNSAPSVCPPDKPPSKPQARGAKLPSEWKPSEAHYAEGYALGFGRPAVDAFAHDMRLWADANSNRAVARKSNWDLTFSGWMRRQKPGTTPPAQAPPGHLADERPGRPPGMPLGAWNKFGQHWTPETPGQLRPEQWEAWKRERDGKIESPAAAPLADGHARVGQPEQQLL